MLTAEKILKSQDIHEPEKVDVPEWGDHVYVRVMNGIERDRFELMVSKGMDKPSTANIRAALCVMTICDQSGKRLFTDNQAAHLGAKNSVALDRIFDVAQKINKLKQEDMDELEKNSVTALKEVSGST